MQYLKKSLKNTIDFLKGTTHYFQNVLIMNGIILFLVLPGISSLTRIILHHSTLSYISYDNLAQILTTHPAVVSLLFLILLLTLLVVFFEFTFLLLTMYFIRLHQPIGLRQLLWLTLKQIKKIRVSTVLFFLFYFLLVLPIGGINFNSDLLSKIKIPAFIMDFIFSNRIWVIGLFGLFYLTMAYLGIRLIFALPEMILRDRPFLQALKESWHVTKKRFFAILGQFILISGTVLLLSSVSSFLLLQIQRVIEAHFNAEALISAVIIMALLQLVFIMNLVLSTIGIFYLIIDDMKDEHFLPALPKEFITTTPKKRLFPLGVVIVGLLAFGVGVGIYDFNYLTASSETQPLALSHRGVSDKNGVQNSIAALEKTHATTSPNYVEMDIQETKDQQFVVLHDPTLTHLARVNKRPQSLSLAKMKQLTLHEDGHTAKLATFDDYLAAANRIHQKLLIEIKVSPLDSKNLVQTFLAKYEKNILAHGHLVQSLDYQTVQQVKALAPAIEMGYILPFNIVGPPKTKADFLTMEFSTINKNFIKAAKADGKKVFVWTPNEEDSMERMQFYGVDGIITDRMDLLNHVLHTKKRHAYANKLMNFVVGIG
jgi:glycerophosphoryl diester phosphodiesterase